MAVNEDDITFSKLFVPLTTRKSVIFIIILGFVVWFRILFNGFVWDDTTYILNNPEVETFNLKTLIGPNMFNSSGYFRPIPAVYFSLLLQLFGGSAFFYHFAQLSLHIACTILLLFIFKHFFRLPLAFFLSLIFLVHPINVESVAYIGASQSELYFLFGGLAFYLCLNRILTDKTIYVTHLLLLLALFTKEVSALFFLLIYFYRMVFRLRLPVKFLLSTFFAVAAYLTVRLSVLQGVLVKMHLIPISEISLADRLTHLPIIHFYYLKTFFFPRILVIDQIWTIRGINWNTFFFPLLVDFLCYGSILALLYYFYRKHRESVVSLIFFSVWYLSGLAILSQIFPLDMTVADRWFYFPVVGLLGILGLFISSVLSRFINQHRSLGLIISAVILVLLSVRTMIRNGNWQNGLTLYSHDAPYYENYDLENYLGYEYASVGQNDAALPHFIRASELLPHDTNLYNIGSIYEQMGNFTQSMNYYDRAINTRDRYLNHLEVRKLAYIGLSRLSILHKSPEDANMIIRRGLEEFPQEGTFWAFLALNEYAMNHRDLALSAAEKAKNLLPNASTEKLYRLILNRQKIDLQLK